MIKVNVNKISQETNNVNIVAVSKRKSVQLIKDAIDAGIKIIGENQIQEAQQKYNELKDYFKQNNVEFHFIGHLQTNKVKKAVLMFDLIQTVDSIKLANEINKRALKINKIQDILIQINIGNEIQKYGIKKEEIFDFLKPLFVPCAFFLCGHESC